MVGVAYRAGDVELSYGHRTAVTCNYTRSLQTIPNLPPGQIGGVHNPRISSVLNGPWRRYFFFGVWGSVGMRPGAPARPARLFCCAIYGAPRTFTRRGRGFSLLRIRRTHSLCKVCVVKNGLAPHREATLVKVLPRKGNLVLKSWFPFPTLS